MNHVPLTASLLPHLHSRPLLATGTFLPEQIHVHPQVHARGASISERPFRIVPLQMPNLVRLRGARKQLPEPRFQVLLWPRAPSSAARDQCELRLEP